MDMNQSMEWIYNLSYEELLVLVGALVGFVKAEVSYKNAASPFE
jgi:hypothetical protein